MNEKDKEDNDKDENARQSDCSETSDDQDVREKPEDELTLNAADVDCIVLPMEVSELLNNFPSWQMACLVNYPVFIKGLHEVICVADFGYKLLINMVTSEQKNNIVKRLYALGIMVTPHHSRYIITTSRMSVGLHVLARGLMGGGLRLVYLAVYGIKIPLYEVRFLHFVKKPPNPPPTQFDVGMNVDCSFIPLFKMAPGYEGRIYPMFLTEYGSICMKLRTDDPEIQVTLKCYPRVVHAIKASRVTSNIPCTNIGVKNKVQLLQNYIYNIENNDIPINGFRFELCFKGNLSLGDAEQLFRNYKVTNSIPEGIKIAIRVSNDDYLEMIQFAYIY